MLRPGCEVELTDLVLGWVSSLSTETQYTLALHGKSYIYMAYIQTMVAYRPFSHPRNAPTHSEMAPLRDRWDTFFGSVWGQPGHYLRWVLGLLGQLGLWASHAYSSCSVTDMWKRITEVLWAKGELGGFSSLLGACCSHTAISSSVQRWQTKASKAKICWRQKSQKRKELWKTSCHQLPNSCPFE